MPRGTLNLRPVIATLRANKSDQNRRPSNGSRRCLKNSAFSADLVDVERLWKVYRDLGNSVDLDKTLATLDGALAPVIDYQALTVYLAEVNPGEEGRLCCAYASGSPIPQWSALEYPLGRGLPGTVAASRRPVLNRALEGPAGPAMAIAVPLEWAGRLIGVVSLYRPARREFAVEDLATLVAVAPKLAVAIDNALLFRRLEAARTRALFERLDAELARTRRSRGSLAVVDCTVEGLDAGARAAERIEGELRRACREYDFVAQSDSSYIVVLADFAPEGLEEAKARIAAVFDEAGWSARIGAALYPADGSDAEDLLAAAHGAAHA